MLFNALTFDVEEYFQVANFEESVSRRDWDGLESRVEIGVRKILKILRENKVKATFFVLGWIAQRYPELVKDIYEQGHELGTHGYDHKLIYEQAPTRFERDSRETVKLIENIIQDKVIGHRAASFSVTGKSRWSLRVLADYGIKYDASIFPIIHHRYGIPDAERFPYKISLNGKDKTMWEFPCSTVRLLGKNIPFSGGGYLRLLPYQIIKWGINRLNQNNQPVMVYLHPWELDSEQPRIKASRLSAFRHYVNLDKTEEKLRKLLQDFHFTTVRQVLDL